MIGILETKMLSKSPKTQKNKFAMKEGVGYSVTISSKHTKNPAHIFPYNKPKIKQQ